MSRQEQAKVIIEKVLADGKEHSLSEIRMECIKANIDIQRHKSAVSNALYNLKKTGQIEEGYTKGAYRRIFENVESELLDKQEEVSSFNGSQMDIDWNKYFILKPQEARYAERKITIMEKGELRLNSALQKEIAKKKVGLIFSNDYKEIIIYTGGNDLHALTKAGTITNHEIVDKLKRVRVKFPVSYTLRWDEKVNVWRGNIDISNKV